MGNYGSYQEILNDEEIVAMVNAIDAHWDGMYDYEELKKYLSDKFNIEIEYIEFYAQDIYECLISKKEGCSVLFRIDDYVKAVLEDYLERCTIEEMQKYGFIPEGQSSEDVKKLVKKHPLSV